MARLSYEDSCRRLQGKYIDSGAVPPMPERMPHPDDDGTSGARFFRTLIGEGEDMSNLTLSRSFFGRSEVRKVSFRGSDFTESYFCWNDFVDIDFTDAILASSDLRASDFTRVKFVNADLRKADLRRSSFNGCDFSGAQLDGSTLTRRQGDKLKLSDDQRSAINWVSEDGPEPGGG
jgi:BTB/POZ domain-containing protein KCTD9